MKKDYIEKKCKKCGLLYIPARNELYCLQCLEIIEVSKISKKNLVKEVIKLRDEVQSFIEDNAGESW